MENTNQFVYVLKLVPRLYDDSNWTQVDENIVDRHFNRLKKYTEEGKVILAGRTLNSGPDTFGLVIFEAASEEEAIDFMKRDPAVEEGVMTAELYPYRVALMRKSE
jgi:uncharacterized protein YciI